MTRLTIYLVVKPIFRRIAFFISIVLGLYGCGAVPNPYLGRCGKAPNLEVISLTMFPDPLPAARRIDQWRAMVRSDSTELCSTTLTIVEAETSVPVTQERQVELSLGANEILLYSVEDYRLTGNRICFELTGYISGNKVAVDSPRRYCTRTIDKGWWSMR
jgi:hypothetical protein